MSAGRLAGVALVALLSLCPAFPGSAAARLRFAIQEFPPFAYTQDQVPTGAAVECVQSVCQAMGESCEIVSYPWPRAQELVRSGAEDGLFVLGWNPERGQWLVFSPPLLITEYGFFVRQDNPLRYKGPEDVSGYTVGVYGPSNTSFTLETVLKEAPGAVMEMRPDDDSGFLKLSRGRVDAVFSNRDVGLAVIRKLGLANLRYAGAQGTTTYYVAFSRLADQALVGRFNAEFRKLQDNGTMPAILRAYGMQPAPRDQGLQ